MKRSLTLLAPAALAAALLASPAAWAQAAPSAEQAAPLAPGSETPPAEAPAAPARPQAAHALSDQTSAMLAAGRPKFSPPKPEPPPKPDAPDPLAGADKPRNKVVRLPKVIVNQKPPPIFAPSQLLGPQGQKDLALKTYLRNPADLSPAAAAAERALFGKYALQQAQEDLRLGQIADQKSEAAMFQRAGDKQESDSIRQSSYDSSLRRGNFGTSAPDQASWNNGYDYLQSLPAAQRQSP